MARKKPTTISREAQEEIAFYAKQRQVLELRCAGLNFSQIAEKLGYANKGGAYKAYRAALANTLPKTLARRERKLNKLRLETLLGTVWNGALGKSPDGEEIPINQFKFEKALKIIEDLRKLEGLDAPHKVHYGQDQEAPLLNPPAQTLNLIQEMPLELKVALLEFLESRNHPTPKQGEEITLPPPPQSTAAQNEHNGI